MNSPFHPEKGPFVRNLKAEERFLGFYILRSKQLESFRDPTRGLYLSLVLSDRSGQVSARVWENAEDANAALSPKEIVKVDGEMELYRDQLQVRVLRIRPANKDEYDMRDMLPVSAFDPDEMLAVVRGYINQITDPGLQALVNVFFKDEIFLRLIRQAPAARKIHHPYIGGLLEHIVELLKLSTTVLEIYPGIDRSLLLTGVLLHDIGKIREFTWEMDIDYTSEGRLLGHIVMTDEMVMDALASFPEFPAELALRLRHMLLSHHGRYEWGSPRRPKTLEAIALHHLENLGAQLNRFHLLLEDAPEGGPWTQYDRMLGRQLYRGEEGDLNIEEQSWME